MPLTSLIGREREITAACTLLLRPEVRFLTLTGTGGVGKTRLALAIATEMQEEFPDGVCFVSLAPIQDADLVLPTIAQTLGLHGSRTRSPLEGLQDALHEQQLLLVLDNFEQVVQAAPSLVELLAACPHLKLLVTSREVLHVRGEREFVVPPLALPDPNHLPEEETLAHYGAVALFLERAREVQPTLQLDSITAPLITEICQRLDGLPLAIELAAARLKLLPLQALLERLEHRLQVLTGGPRDLPARQQTLRDTIAWSYDALSQEEQRLFRLIAIFAGGCTLEAIEQVSRASGAENVLVLDGVTSLVDKHLLRLSEQGYLERENRRLLMLETIREYRLEALEARGELEAIRQGHAAYYLRLAEEAEVHLFGAEQLRWLDWLEREYDNLRAVLSWAMEQAKGEEARQKPETALRLVGVLVRFWAVRGYPGEGRTWLERALARSEDSEGIPPAVWARALSGAGYLAFHQGDVDRAEVLCEEGLKLYRAARQTSKTQDMASSLLWLSLLALRKGNDRQVHFLFEESRAQALEAGDARSLANLLLFSAIAAIDRGEYDEACSLLEESRVLFQEMNNKEDLVWSLLHLGRVLFAQGDEARAQALVAEGLTFSRETHYRVGSACSLYLLGRFSLTRGEERRAYPLLEESLSLFKALREQQSAAHVLSWLARVATMQGEEAAARSCCEESMSLFRQVDDPEGMAFCLQGLGAGVAGQGNLLWAARLWRAAENLSGVEGPRGPFFLPVERTKAERMEHERTVRAVRTELGVRDFTEAWAEGRAMTPEQALAAQNQPVNADRTPAKPGAKAREATHRGRSPAYPQGLTEREGEVLRLVAHGLTDAQIAEALVISPRTVNAHLRSIYTKLDITSRNAATYFALEHDLI